VQGPDEVHFVDHLLTQLEAELGGRTAPVGLELQIESARGAEALPAIAAASTRTETLVFGPGDYAADLGIPQLSVGAIERGYPGDQWHYVLSRLVIAARARGLQAIDGPWAAVRDLDGFRESAGRARLLGCEGKWVLHPDQIAAANEAFTPAQAHYDDAEALLDAYREATDEGRGAVRWRGEMIDEASRKLAEQIAARGRAAGLQRSPAG
jgi:citrate lyase subunit beta/citryl-CoA lyase